MPAPAVPPPSAAPAKPAPMRHFGRFELRLLLGKSARSMSWLVFDPASQRELMLTMPRVQPADAAALDRWFVDARKASRLDHPNLLPVVETDVHDNWPYVACERGTDTTLVERLAVGKPPPGEAVEWICEALEGLAFAHEAGVSHHDLQLHNLVISEQGTVRVMACAAALAVTPRTTAGAVSVDLGQLQTQRQAAERDLLSMGVLLHGLLAGTPALDESDTSKVIERMPPLGRDMLRLPWSTPHPIPEPLRVIVNRSTDRQERYRYLSARTVLRALNGWREAAAHDTGGSLGLLLDRLHTVGHLPALPGVDARVAKLASMETQRTDEMAEVILQDMALTFEVLRNVNSAQVQGTQVAGNGPVLTMRRAVALMGLNGLRQASASLRTWPGPLSESGAVALRKLMDEVRLAATLSQWFRPAGYDSEVVFLLGLMQNLGRLMCRYHFPDDAEQIASLMRPGPLTSDGREQPGMQQDAASFAVMGIDIETLGVAVARQWGMPEDVLHMIRRLPSDRPVRSADSDADLLRATASAANDVVDVVTRLSGPQVNVALAGIAQRYHRLLGLTPRDITDALQQARQAMQAGSSIAAAVASTQAPSTSTQRPAGATRSATSSDKPVSPLRERAAASNLRQP